ncbi:hypothetical protein ACFVDQ_43005 [Streptomyces sp. NPDC057684]|uniref:hypothetical protein n=1 Tax=Streptomyces sp. NPDC057684 TaxID=3346211 RepID=UPI0036C335D1
MFYLVDEGTPDVTLQEQEVTGARWLASSDATSPTLRAKLLDSGLDGGPEPVNASALIHNGAGAYLLHLRDARPDIWEPWTTAGQSGAKVYRPPLRMRPVAGRRARVVPVNQPNSA